MWEARTASRLRVLPSEPPLGPWLFRRMVEVLAIGFVDGIILT